MRVLRVIPTPTAPEARFSVIVPIETLFTKNWMPVVVLYQSSLYQVPEATLEVVASLVGVPEASDLRAIFWSTPESTSKEIESFPNLAVPKLSP